MKVLFLICILIMAAIVAANAQSKSDTPRQLQEGVYLKDGGVIDSLYTRCVVVKIKRTNWGYHHLLVADKGDTLYSYYQTRFKIDSCYKFPTMDLKKYKL